MDFPICDHLSEYRDCLREAESAYTEVLAGIDRYRQGREVATIRMTLAGHVDRWLEACGRLRALLVRLVAAGDVVLPHRKEGLPRCARCRCAIHRLEFPEWDFTAEGAARFRGADIPADRSARPTVAPADR